MRTRPAGARGREFGDLTRLNDASTNRMAANLRILFYLILLNVSIPRARMTLHHIDRHITISILFLMIDRLALIIACFHTFDRRHVDQLLLSTPAVHCLN